MTHADVLRIAGEAAPELMEKTAALLRETEEVSPAHAAQTVAELRAVTSSVIEKVKESGVGRQMLSALKSAPAKAVGGVATAVLAGLGVAAATDLYNAARRGINSGTNWKRMIEANPRLRDHPLADVRANFDSIQKTAPELAANPLACGAAVEQLVSSPGMQYHTLLTNMAESQKKLVDAQYKLPSAGGGGKK